MYKILYIQNKVKKKYWYEKWNKKIHVIERNMDILHPINDKQKKKKGNPFYEKHNLIKQSTRNYKASH